MFKKIALCCMIATSSMQADFPDNLVNKIARGALRAAAVGVGSYATKYILTAAAEKLEKDSTISSSNAERAKKIIAIRSYLFPILMFLAECKDIHDYRYFTPKISFSDLINKVNFGTSLIGFETVSFRIIKNFLNYLIK